MSAFEVSIVLPIHNQSDHIATLIPEYVRVLDSLSIRYELVLVPNACSDDSTAVCARLVEQSDKKIQMVALELGGWGRAVKAGLDAATGKHLCFTNSARTSP